MKQNYSYPKIYAGGVNIKKWSSVSKADQKKALLKEWYVYFSFRDPQTGKLKRQTNIKAGANKYKTRRDRLSVLKTIQKNLLLLLEAGFTPYGDNTTLIEKFFKPDSIIENQNNVTEPITPPVKKTEIITLETSIELGLKIKEKVQNPNSFVKFKSHINIFKKWLDNSSLLGTDINNITSKIIIQYLNDTLQRSSARNRNNARTNLSSLFQTLEDNEVIQENFIKKINVLRTKPERNKTYTPKLQKEIYDHLKEKDPLMLLFVQFISYNLLRPIEVCRLQVKDIDIEDGKIYIRAKNKAVKIKIIPDIMINELPDLSNCDKEHLLFTPEGLGKKWDIPETDRRNYFTRRFKKTKQFFNLGKDYGLYSFRHTFITLLYRNLEKDFSPFEAKSRLMLITGHTTMVSLEKYLRDIDAELPEDYSHLFDTINFNNK